MKNRERNIGCLSRGLFSNTDRATQSGVSSAWGWGFDAGMVVLIVLIVHFVVDAAVSAVVAVVVVVVSNIFPVVQQPAR